jgi:hypothetical protein
MLRPFTIIRHDPATGALRVVTDAPSDVVLQELLTIGVDMHRHTARVLQMRERALFFRSNGSTMRVMDVHVEPPLQPTPPWPQALVIERLSLREQLRQWGMGDPWEWQVPVRRIASEEEIGRVPMHAHSASDGEVTCSVCLEDAVPGDALKKTRCGHSFHGDCIDQWLRKNVTCPVCRVAVC